MSQNINLSGYLKRKLGFLSMWRTALVEVKGVNLIIHKGKTSEIESCFQITPETEIIEEKNDRPPKLTIRNGEEFVSLQTDTVETMFLWVQTLRTLTYRSKDISIDDFNIISVIGRGYYGKVMLVENKYSKEIYALKSIHKDRLIEEKKVNTVLRERNVLAKINHPFIVQIKFAFQNEKKVYIGLEYVPGGELFRMLQLVPSLAPKAVRFYIAEVALALEYIHSLGIIYRDLKTENILITQKGHLKLTDFGLAKIVDTEDGEGGSTKTFCGTNEYLAPEIVKHEAYGYAIDWWALGILTYELTFGETPFCNQSKKVIYEKILHDEPFFPAETPEETVDFIKKLLKKDPKKRGNFNDLKNHPFWHGLNFDNVAALKVKPPFRPRIASDRCVMNFDSEFTHEANIDSAANAVISNDEFKGFSYIANDEILDGSMPNG